MRLKDFLDMYDLDMIDKPSVYRSPHSASSLLVCKTLAVAPEVVGSRRAKMKASEDTLDDTAELVVLAGMSIEEYRKTGVVLSSHNAELIIGKAVSTWKESNSLYAIIDFAPPGVSSKADEVWGLIQCGMCSGVSIGFDPIEVQPMDPTRPRGPKKYVKSILREISIVAMPAHPKAVILEKSSPSETTKAARMARAQAIARDNGYVIQPRRTTEQIRRHVRATAIAYGGYDPADPRLPSVTGGKAHQS